MSDYLFFFKHEVLRFFSWRNIIALVLLFALVLGYVQYGVFKHEKSLGEEGNFKEFEKTKVTSFQNYRQYGFYGFRMLLLPHPVSIFFINSTPLSSVNSYVDSGSRLQVYKPMQGASVFESAKYWLSDYSGIVLFFAGILALFYGMEALRNKDYLMFLSTITGRKSVFFPVLIPRAVLLFLVLLSIKICAVLLISINGIHVPIDKHLLAFQGFTFLVSLVFLVLGSVFSANKKMISGILRSLTCWFVLLFVIPTALNIFIEIMANSMTSVYELESKKLKILMESERKIQEQVGIFKLGKMPEESRKALVLEYRNNEFKKMQQMEEKLIAEMQRNVSLFQGLSTFFPTTAYISINHELSSQGYENLLEFNRIVKKIKEEFFDFYMDKVFFSNYSEVESFLKNDQNVYKAQPRIPGFFVRAVLITLAWLIVLTAISYYKHNKMMFLLEKKDDQYREPDLDLRSNSIRMWNVTGNRFKNQLFGLLSGRSREFKRKGYKFKVSLDGRDLTAGGPQENFLFLLNLRNMPDIKIKLFLSLAMDCLKVPAQKREEIFAAYNLKALGSKTFGQLDIIDLGKIYLALLDMKKFKVYLVNDVARGMTVDFAIELKDKLDNLWDEGALVLFLTTDPLLIKKWQPGMYFHEDYTWCDIVVSHTDLKRSDDEPS